LNANGSSGKKRVKRIVFMMREREGEVLVKHMKEANDKNDGDG